MNSMFFGCSSIKKIELSNFDTQNVTYMSEMFYRCSSLKDLNLSNFNTSSVSCMRGMFSKSQLELKLKIREQCETFYDEAFI